MITNYGSLSVEIYESLFFSTNGSYFKDIYRNGSKIACAHYTDGKRDWVIWLNKSSSEPIELTRAQGFKYWRKHFANRPCYSLPKELAEATDRDFRSSGVFYSKKRGEVIGYMG